MEKIFYFKKAERQLDYADFNCHYWSLGSYSRHNHVDYYEIIIPTAEPFVNTVNDKIYSVSKRDVLIIPPGISHSITAIGTSTAPHHNIAIKAERFENFIRTKKHLYDALRTGEPYKIKTDESVFAVISGLLDSINNSSYDEKFLLLMETVLHLIACCSLLISEGKGYSENAVTAFCIDAINKIDDYSYISESIAEIYRAYPISHTTFSAEFKRLTGKRAVDYLSQKKMEYAKSLILTTSLSVLEIAGLIGYESSSHFIRKFGKEFGCSPLKFRKAHKSKKEESAD